MQLTNVVSYMRCAIVVKKAKEQKIVLDISSFKSSFDSFYVSVVVLFVRRPFLWLHLNQFKHAPNSTMENQFSKEKC